MEVQVHGATASMGLEGLHPMDEAFAMGLFSIVNAFQPAYLFSNHRKPISQLENLQDQHLCFAPPSYSTHNITF